MRSRASGIWGFVLVTAVMLATSSSTRGQDWNKIATLPASAHCAFFWDLNHGVVGVYTIKFNVISGAGIYYYNNGTWTQGKYPEALRAIWSIRQLKPGVLYATGGASKIWISTDSGKNWGLTTVPSGSARDVYLTPDSSLRTTTGTFARLDDKICVTTEAVPRYSRDGGLTWKTSTGMTDDGSGTGCFADVCRRAFFIPDVWGNVFVSRDSGASWGPVNASPYALGFVNTGILDGSGGMIYMQAINGGLYESADIGCSWQRTRGPGAFAANIRLFSFLDGAGAIAFHDAEVWLGTGLNTTLHPASPITFRDWAITDCILSHLQILVWPTGIPYPLHFITEGNAEHEVSPTDTTIMTSALDTTFLTFRVSSPGLHGTGDILVHCAPTTPCWPIASWDTSFVDTNATSAYLQIQTRSDTIRACDSVDIPIVIGSQFCDTVSLTELGIPNDSLSSFRLTSGNGMTIEPGGKDTAWFRYTPRGRAEDRSYSIQISCLLSPTGLRLDTAIPIHLAALQDPRCQKDTSRKDTTQSSVEPSTSDSRGGYSRLRMSIDGKILHFWLSAGEPVSSCIRAQIVNVLGVVVSEQRSGGASNPWDVSQLPPGVYLLKVRNGESETACRFILGK